MDIVDEQAIARKADWVITDQIGSLSQTVYDLSWKKVGTIQVQKNVYDIIRHKNLPTYLVGKFQPVRGDDLGRDDLNAGKIAFATVFYIKLSAVKDHGFRDKGAVLGYSNLHNVDVVGVHEDARGQGIAKNMYKWFVSQDILLLGDREQYFGARKLWAALSREIDVVVDIVDYSLVTVIDRGVTLHQGQYDEDFDQRGWSYGEDKANIRVVLRKVL